MTLEDVAVLGECGLGDRDSSFSLLVLVFVSDAVISVPDWCGFERSRSECCLHILVCHFQSSPLSSTYSSSDPDFHFHQLTPLLFVIVHVVY